MTKAHNIQIFNNRKVRVVWDSDQEKAFFSIVDVCAVLTESPDPSKYWRVLKSRMKKEGAETATICSMLKLQAADGKMRLTDVADQQQIFRIIQSIPSPKAEPFKQWMAQVASQRIDQAQDPELSIAQMVEDYKRLGYSAEWINRRMRSIEVRKQLTDEWERCGVKAGQYASLTDIVTQTWSGMTTREYKDHKSLRKKESLRDNMTNVEIALNMLAEASTTEISKQENPHTFRDNARVAKSGGSVAKTARNALESKLGHSVISALNASDYLKLSEGLESDDTPKS